MHELKHISKAAIPAALERAERYRLLNEPHEAESICRDVLVAEPENRQALIILLLALTDQLELRGTAALDEALTVLAHIPDEYARAYYDGVVHERLAKFRLRHRESGSVIRRSLRRAMECFERAEKLRPAGNDEALLRWNTCVRVLRRHPWIEEAAEGEPHPGPGLDEGAEMMLE